MGILDLALRHRFIWQLREQEKRSYKIGALAFRSGSEISEQAAYVESYYSGTYIY